MPEIQTPDASVRIAMEDGRPNSTWYRILSRLVDLFNSTSADVDSPTSGLATKATKEQDWAESALIEFADDKDYRIVLDSAFAWTITSVVTRSSTGTCTLTVKIDTTALGGSANSVSTSEQTQAHSSDNAVAAGDDIVLTVSSNSAAEGVAVTLKGTRTLD